MCGLRGGDTGSRGSASKTFERGRDTFVLHVGDSSLASGEEATTRSCLVCAPTLLKGPSPTLIITSGPPPRGLVISSCLYAMGRRGCGGALISSPGPPAGGPGCNKSLPKQRGAFPFVTGISTHAMTCLEFENGSRTANVDCRFRISVHLSEHHP